jgi:hypothetical protein
MRSFNFVVERDPDTGLSSDTFRVGPGPTARARTSTNFSATFKKS